MKYNYVEHYRKLKKKIDDNYGNVHLCGNCEYMTRCIRNVIQVNDNINSKKRLMHKYAKFVKDFSIEPYAPNHRQSGFVAVYDCERYKFEGYEGDECDAL